MSLSNPTNPPIVNEHVATRVSTGLVFAVDENQTKVNQIHGINPAGSTGAGIPKPVTSVTASIANASSGSTITVSVRFQRNPQDNNFAGINIYAKGYQGNNTPVKVGGGQDSPCTVILNNTGESVTLIVQSVGNGGVTPIASSPTYGIKLPKSKTGGAGKTTITSASTLDQLPNGTTFAKPLAAALSEGKVTPAHIAAQTLGFVTLVQNFAGGSTNPAGTGWVLLGTVTIDVPQGTNSITFTLTGSNTGVGSKQLSSMGFSIYSGSAPATPQTFASWSGSPIPITLTTPTTGTGLTLGVYGNVGNGAFLSISVTASASLVTSLRTGSLT